MGERYDGWVACEVGGDGASHQGVTRAAALAAVADDCAEDVSIGWRDPGCVEVHLYERPELIREDDPRWEDYGGGPGWDWICVELVPTETATVRIWIDGDPEDGDVRWVEVLGG